MAIVGGGTEARVEVPAPDGAVVGAGQEAIGSHQRQPPHAITVTCKLARHLHKGGSYRDVAQQAAMLELQATVIALQAAVVALHDLHNTAHCAANSNDTRELQAKCAYLAIPPPQDGAFFISLLLVAFIII